VMDQLVSLRAKAGHALLLDCRSLQWRHLPFDPAGQELAVLVIDTQTRHALVSGAYGQRRLSCEEAAQILDVASLREATEASLGAARNRLGPERFERALHVVSENARVLDAVAILEASLAGGTGTGATGDLRDLGALLSASHASLRDSFEVSCPELDSVCESAESAGALGARMIGGGFGGSAIALTPTDRIEAVISSVAAAAAKRSFPKPCIFAAHPAGGASRAG
jgi:galactokinase